MHKKYAYVDCFNRIKDLPVKNPLIKYLGEASLKKYIINKFPNTIEEAEFAGVPGYIVKLPLIKPLNDNDYEYISQVIHAFNENIIYEDVNILVLNEALMPYRDLFELLVADDIMLFVFYIKNILEEAKRMLKKPEKNIRYVLIDGFEAEYILDHIYEDINTLTLVTDEPEKYELKLKQIYDECGLAIQITDKKLRQNIHGEIIVNCSRSYDKLFYCYDNDAILIDFMSSYDILLKTKLKRPDIHIIHQMDIIYLNEKWQPELLLGILLNGERLLRNIYLGGYRYDLKEKVDVILNDYPLKFILKGL